MDIVTINVDRSELTEVKIIFLDIDGVLNNHLEADTHLTATVDKQYQGLYSPRCVDRLNSLVENTGAVIVLSSTWRLGLELSQIKLLLLSMGVKAEVIGKTDYVEHSFTFRGNEIYKWIQDNEKEYNLNEFNYKSYVILDDDTDMLMCQQNNYVNCDPEIGMTDRVVHKSTAILNHSPCEDTGQEYK